MHVSSLTLEESLHHIRILHSQLTKSACSRRRLQRERIAHYTVKRRNPSEASSLDLTQRTCTMVTLDLAHVRYMVSCHSGLLTKIKINKHRKTQIHLPIGHTPYTAPLVNTITKSSISLKWQMSICGHKRAHFRRLKVLPKLHRPRMRS